MKMANTPPRPVLPAPPTVGPAKPVAAPEVPHGAAIEPVPDAWFTDFEAEPDASADDDLPASMIETQVVDTVASNDGGAFDDDDAAPVLGPVLTGAVAEVGSEVPDEPTAERGGPQLPRAPVPAAPRQRRMTQLIAGGIATATAIVLAIRCASGPSNVIAHDDGTVARAGGASLDDDRPRAPSDGVAQQASAEQGEAQQRDAAKAEAANAEAAKAEAAKADAAEAEAAKAEAAKVDEANTDDAQPDDAKAEAQTDDGADEAQLDDARTDTAGPAADQRSAAASKSSGRTDNAGSASTRSNEPQLTAEELLELARAAWKSGNARETYKYANKSRYKQPSAEATELATLAACKMKLDDAAKGTFKDLSGDRRKRVRTACRELGVRVGL
jgi:hypothetical protein